MSKKRVFIVIGIIAFIFLFIHVLRLLNSPSDAQSAIHEAQKSIDAVSDSLALSRKRINSMVERIDRSQQFIQNSRNDFKNISSKNQLAEAQRKKFTDSLKVELENEEKLLNSLQTQLKSLELKRE